MNDSAALRSAALSQGVIASAVCEAISPADQEIASSQTTLLAMTPPKTPAIRTNVARQYHREGNVQ
jgi:hypothetical protein